jgi:hypothetical protein
MSWVTARGNGVGVGVCGVAVSVGLGSGVGVFASVAVRAKVGTAPAVAVGIAVGIGNSAGVHELVSISKTKRAGLRRFILGSLCQMGSFYHRGVLASNAPDPDGTFSFARAS